MIKFKNVSKIYDNDVTAVTDIDLHIKKGEFVFLIGASGAGKSTLIKMLLKEEDPTTGSIIIDQDSITNLHRRKTPLLRRKMGVVFQDFRLLRNKTVYENVAYALEIMEVKPRYIRKKVSLVLNLVKLSDKAEAMPNQLSGGEQQRVSIARAMINDPKILIADEPTGNLDWETANEIMEVLVQINNQKGTTIVMATHDKGIVNMMKKRVIELKDGSIISDRNQGGYKNNEIKNNSIFY